MPPCAHADATHPAVLRVPARCRCRYASKAEIEAQDMWRYTRNGEGWGTRDVCAYLLTCHTWVLHNAKPVVVPVWCLDSFPFLGAMYEMSNWNAPFPRPRFFCRLLLAGTETTGGSSKLQATTCRCLSFDVPGVLDASKVLFPRRNRNLVHPHASSSLPLSSLLLTSRGLSIPLLIPNFRKSHACAVPQAHLPDGSSR